MKTTAIKLDRQACGGVGGGGGGGGGGGEEKRQKIIATHRNMNIHRAVLYMASVQALERNEIETLQVSHQ